MKDENWGVVVVLVLALGLALLGGYELTRKSDSELAAMATPIAVRATQSGQGRAMSGQAQGLPLPAGVEVTAAEVVTYTYRLNDRGEKVWSEAGKIAEGRLIKAQGCVSGYRQVEYQPDLGRPGFWRVEWAKCTPD